MTIARHHLELFRETALTCCLSGTLSTPAHFYGRGLVGYVAHWSHEEQLTAKIAKNCEREISNTFNCEANLF